MKHIRLTLLCTVALLMHGCAMFQSPQERAEAGWETVTIASFDQMEPAIDPYLGVDTIGVLTLVESDDEPKDLVEKAWQSLKGGDYKRARILLGQALYVDGKYKEAIALNNQITADLNVYAYKNSFDLMADKTVYLANEGDSLENISEQAYGTKNYFPFLMRLNTLTQSTLAQGDIVWTPPIIGQSKSVSIKAKPKAAVVNKKALPVIQKKEQVLEDKNTADKSKKIPKVTNKGVSKLSEAVEFSGKKILTEDKKTPPEDKQVPPEDNLKKEESDAIDNSETDGLKSIKPAKSVKEIVRIHQESAQTENKEGLSELEVKGLSELRKGGRKDAYLLLLSAPRLSTDSQKILDELKVELIDEPYLRGISNYQSQNLKQAIADFDQVLSVAPDHIQASLYRARCVRLLEKLQTIQ